MSQISRLFDNPKSATAAVAELKASQFKNVESVANGKGGTLVSVEAPFGMGGKAEQILNRHGPSKAATSTRSNGVGAEAAAAPLSRALHVPVLTNPSTNVSGFPLTTDSRTTSAALGFPELISSNTFFSGFPLLIKSGPFSSLASSQQPSSSLIDNPAPLSSALGLPVLLRA
jgi:hypothetical protein